MKLPKKSVLTLVSLVTLLGGAGYAQSQARSSSANTNLNIKVYRNHGWMTGKCILKVEHDGSSFTYTPSLDSKSGFRGPWPSEAGDLYMSFTASDEKPTAITPAALETRPETEDESLIVHFEKVNGEMRPTGYMYKNLALMQRNSLIEPSVCTGL